jgi:tetratricopeptide (TPR) repeat protein
MKKLLNNSAWFQAVWIILFAASNVLGQAPFRSETTNTPVGFVEAPVKYGVPILFRIDSKQVSDLLSDAESVTLLLYKNLLNPPEEIPLTVLDGEWQASVAFSDTSVKALFYAFSIESLSEEKYLLAVGQDLWDVLVVDASGRPVYGAYQERALSYTGISDKRPEDLGRALIDIQQELLLHPDNYSARMLKYSILLKESEFSADIRRKVELEVDSLLSIPMDRERVMNFAIGVYRMLGENDKAQMIEKSLIAQNPTGERSAMKRFSDILQIKEPAEKRQALERFLADFPNSRVTEPVLAQLASSTIELGDTTGMVRTGDRLLEKASTLTGANALAGIAGVFADGHIELQRALAYVQKALVLVRSGSGISGASGSSQDAEEERRNAEAQYRDVLGWVLLKRGETVQALDELQEAVKNQLQAGSFYHLAVAYEKIGKENEALIYYGRAAAFSGTAGETAYAAFRSLWRTTNKDTLQGDAFLDQQARWVEEQSREKILSLRSIRPAPDFWLTDIKGSRVQLSDQKDNVVLLCFWGTWSKSSQLLLKALQDLTDQYGQSVLFLSVAMDQDKNAVRQFVKKERIFLPVLFNDQQEKDYMLEGVPAVFLIDRSGNIQFSHKGYRIDINQILSVELDDLLGAKSL